MTVALEAVEGLKDKVRWVRLPRFRSRSRVAHLMQMLLTASAIERRTPNEQESGWSPLIGSSIGLYKRDPLGNIIPRHHTRKHLLTHVHDCTLRVHQMELSLRQPDTRSISQEGSTSFP